MTLHEHRWVSKGGKASGNCAVVYCSTCGEVRKASDSPAWRNEQTARDRQWIINLIRSEYDKAPDYFKAGDNWDDGTGSIADQIIARYFSRASTLPSTDGGGK